MPWVALLFKVMFMFPGFGHKIAVIEKVAVNELNKQNNPPGYHRRLGLLVEHSSPVLALSLHWPPS